MNYILIDNFFKNPDVIRQFALSKEYIKSSKKTGWKGYRTNIDDVELVNYIKNKLIAYKSQLDYTLSQDQEYISSILSEISSINKKLWYVHALDLNNTFTEILKNIETIQGYILLKAISKVLKKNSDPSTISSDIKDVLITTVQNKIDSVTKILNVD